MTNNSVITALNTKACSFMSAGRYKEAGQLLLTALQQIKSCILPTPSVQQDPSSDIFLQPCRVEVNNHDTTCLSLYRWAILADENGTSSCEDVIRQLSAVLLYNMGLSYQVMGMQDGSERSFQVALSLYSHAISLLSADAGAQLPLRFALLNNRGCILEHFCEFRKAQECLAIVGHLLDVFYPVSPNELSREDLLDIRMNVTLSLGLHSHAATA